MQPVPTYFKKTVSPVGELTLIASDRGLQALLLPNSTKFTIEHDWVESENHPLLLRTQKQLDEYFVGKRTAFDIKLDLRGTVFQIKAWRELQKIPYGETISYGEQARRMGDAKKARPAGMANGRNPISIIVPCHRVIGVDGGLTGYGGGLPLKQQLLAFEKAHISLAA